MTLPTAKELTVRELRALADRIEERDLAGSNNAFAHHSLQRLHRHELKLALSAIRGWANYIEANYLDEGIQQ